MSDTLKILAYAVLFGIILVIIFVRSPGVSGESGGKQASDIINSTSSGFAGIIKAATGA